MRASMGGAPSAGRTRKLAPTGLAHVGHRQRHDAAVGELGGAGHAAGLGLGVAFQRVAGARRDGARHVQDDQPPVDVAAVADAHDRLLAQVAAFALVDRLGQAHLHREVVGRDLDPEPRLQRVDAGGLGGAGVQRRRRPRWSAARAAPRWSPPGRRPRTRRCPARAPARPRILRRRRGAGRARAPRPGRPRRTPALPSRCAAAGPNMDRKTKSATGAAVKSSMIA